MKSLGDNTCSSFLYLLRNTSLFTKGFFRLKWVNDVPESPQLNHVELGLKPNSPQAQIPTPQISLLTPGLALQNDRSK